MIKVMIIAATMFGAGTAFADEVVIHRDSAPVIVDHAAPSTSTTVEHRSSSDGCASKSVHSENDMGDSKTVTKTNCD
jgi:hypothetical protein